MKSTLPPEGSRLVGQDLVAAEWNNVAWGNYEANLEFLRQVLLSGPPVHVLEIGCGKGALLDRLRVAGHTATGIDIDIDAISACLAAYPGSAVAIASGDNLPFADASFDVVASFDVFEHIAASDRHLREVKRVLKSGGSYLLQTPNRWTNVPFELVRQWKKFGTGPLASYRALMREHCALHSYWQLKRRLSRNGFDPRFLDIPVVNEYFKAKLRTYLGASADFLLAALNPDRLPLSLRTNFYVHALAR